MPGTRLHHIKVGVEHELAHGIECEPRHNVVEQHWFAIVFRNQIGKSFDLTQYPGYISGNCLKEVSNERLHLLVIQAGCNAHLVPNA